MKRVFVIILAIAAAAMGCRAQEVVKINSTRQAVKRTGDALLVAMPLATLTAVIVERDWQGLKQAAFSTATNLGASYLLKYTVHKMRPDRSDNHAFPSAHTAGAVVHNPILQLRLEVWRACLCACYVCGLEPHLCQEARLVGCGDWRGDRCRQQLYFYPSVCQKA